MLKLKKKSGGGGASWMDTYGDMVTLLLCFFVLLYSMSTISEENWKALIMSFNPNAATAITVSSGSEGPIAEDGEGGINMAQAQVDEQMEELYEELMEYVEESHAQNDISVTTGDGKIFISFNQVVFFDGNSAVLKPEATPVLNMVSEMLSKASGAIDEVRVLGHTAQEDPDRPNNITVDRTLASQRATNVVIFVQQHSSLDPARLISEGLGQWRPIGDNATSEGRRQNRRVEMIISGRDLEQELEDGILQYQTDDLPGSGGTPG